MVCVVERRLFKKAHTPSVYTPPCTHECTGGYAGNDAMGDDGEEEEEVAADEGAPMMRQTSVIEHCMMVNGEERLRVKLTLSVAGMVCRGGVLSFAYGCRCVESCIQV